MVQPGAENLVRVSLVDGQGDLLVRQVIRLDGSPVDALEWTTQLAFEIPGESAPAMLLVTTLDHAQRPIAVRTVELTLQGAGNVEVSPTFIPEPWLKITQPDPGAVIHTSPLVVIGQVAPINDNPVSFSLVNERGFAIITRQLIVEKHGEAIDFEVSLPFSSTYAIRDMRLIIRQASMITSVNAILDSLPITIEP